jgi:L-iditol 2-dehydrogenase
MGLLVAECARALGAGRVIVVGRGDRLAKAAELGHETVDFTLGDPVSAVRELTDGHGPEVALECSGDADALGQCTEMVRKGGRVAVIGIPQRDASVRLQRVVLDEVDIAGVRASAGEMSEVISLVAAGRIRLQPLLTHRFPLEDFAEAYRTFTERVGGALKVVVESAPVGATDPAAHADGAIV